MAQPALVNERVFREDRIEENHRLGLSAQEADFQFLPELVGVRTWLAATQLASKKFSLVATPETVVRQRRNTQSWGRLAPFFLIRLSSLILLTASSYLPAR